MSWELPALTLLSLSAVGFWWLGSPQSGYRKAFFVLICAVALVIDPRQHLLRIFYDAQNVILEFRLGALLVQHSKMVLALGAVVWLLHRSWQTLWKPVPELINILGVDIPEPPDVSLAGIKSDAATLSWTRPTSNRPVQKYSIQVNGVHVGDSPGNEVAITVTGLKPNHYYNIRVVAVGPNNFQAGSPLIRLRTFGKDGRPLLGNSRLPTNFTDPDQPRTGPGDDESDDSDDAQFPVPSVEAAPVLDGTSSTREVNGIVPGQRRNTINRRHSPSVASMDQPHIHLPAPDGPELSLDELNSKFEEIRKEYDDTLTVYAKEQAESQQQEDELKKEKERKRLILKEKEEQTAQLKIMVRVTMEQMRTVEKERVKKEQQLKDKENKKSKVRDSVSKFESEAQRMKKEREGFETQKARLKKKRDVDALKLDESNADLQEKCAELEAELKDKGKQLQDLKAAREQLPDAHDEQFKEEDVRLKRDWESRRKELHSRWLVEHQKGYELDQEIAGLSEQLRIYQPLINYYNLGNASNVDFELAPEPQPRRPSQQSISLQNVTMPLPGQTILAESGFPPPSTGISRFASGLFMDMSAHRSTEPPTEAELRDAAGPLSPSAARILLPSELFEDMDESDTKERDSPMLPEPTIGGEEDAQSPASSSPSFNIFASPHGSSINLPFPQYTDTNDRSPSMASLGLNHAAKSPPPTSYRLSNLLATFQRNRGAKATDELGPAFGSLKPGQSQSLPQGSDEQDVLENRRKLSLNWMNRNSTGPDSFVGSPFSSSKPFSARRLFPFGGSNAGVSERDPDQPRPASIASVDRPRPSTDSGSIWGLQGDHGLFGQKNRLWSPDEGRWPSRSGSRRPSIHGSPSLLTTTLASADDEILDEHELLDPQTSPSQIGVIGSRPRLMSQRLNPTAPTFMGNLFRKDKEGKGKDKAKDDKNRGKVPTTPSIEVPPGLDDSPSDSRISRDTLSIHTQPSVSESHESLMLDSTMSNTPSDHNSNSGSIAKDQENVVKKLFRKGSSSKFSLSSRLGKESGLFKKGPSSVGNSDRNIPTDHRSSIGDIDDMGEDAANLARSYESLGGSPSLVPSKSKEGKESRMTSWRFLKIKGKDAPSKEKESLDLERPLEEES